MRAGTLELPHPAQHDVYQSNQNGMNFKNGPNSPDLRLLSFVSRSPGYSFCTQICPRSLKSMQTSEKPSGRTHINSIKVI